MCATAASDRVLNTAAALFYKHGIRAIGVDTVVAGSGVAKMTLYKHFPSKDALIVAALEQQSRNWQAWLQEALDALGGQPVDRLLHVFDVLEAWMTAPAFQGCPILNAAIELRDSSHPAHPVIQAHQTWLRGLMLELVHAAGLLEPECSADGLSLLIEGAIVSRQLGVAPTPAATAKCLATLLIDARRQPSLAGAGAHRLEPTAAARSEAPAKVQEPEPRDEKRKKKRHKSKKR